ncbi:hypothetical protein MPLA_1700024 [Mesorhizobium sp. ORS 3359]|nr:hypothetical protein MPLA_1700024 [Mesorhizobium sp. ORS 3359]
MIAKKAASPFDRHQGQGNLRSELNPGRLRDRYAGELRAVRVDILKYAFQAWDDRRESGRHLARTA